MCANLAQLELALSVGFPQRFAFGVGTVSRPNERRV